MELIAEEVRTQVLKLCITLLKIKNKLQYRKICAWWPKRLTDGTLIHQFEPNYKRLILE